MHESTFNPKENRVVTILMAALLVGFGWQIRGSGTSDPSVVVLLFLLFLSIHYSPRKKFNILSFAFVVFAITIMRTGWGTFISQAGIPWVVPGYLLADFDIAVPWWSGYFWLFNVGISWFGLGSLLFGGYFFTTQNYGFRDIVIIFVLFITTSYAVGFLADFLIPYLAPTYYNEIYLTGISERSYGSMRGNMSKAMAIIPALIYIRFVRKDKEFSNRAIAAMLFFAFSLTIATLLEINSSTAWGLWEYTTGFIFGALIFWFFGRFTDDQLAETNVASGLDVPNWNPIAKVILYSVAYYWVLLHGLAESLESGIRIALSSSGIEYTSDVPMVKIIIIVTGLSIFWLCLQGKIGSSFVDKSFRENSLIALIVLLPVYYFNFAMQHIIAGTLFELDWNASPVWLDTLSFAVVEAYCIYLLKRYREAA